MEVVKESVTQLWHGWAKFGTTRSRVVSTNLGTGALKGILLRAPGSGDANPNDVPVYVGGSGVTANNLPETGGMPLCPGETLFIPLENLQLLYAISTQPNQQLAWIAM